MSKKTLANKVVRILLMVVMVLPNIIPMSVIAEEMDDVYEEREKVIEDLIYENSDMSDVEFLTIINQLNIQLKEDKLFIDGIESDLSRYNPNNIDELIDRLHNIEDQNNDSNEEDQDTIIDDSMTDIEEGTVEAEEELETNDEDNEEVLFGQAVEGEVEEHSPLINIAEDQETYSYSRSSEINELLHGKTEEPVSSRSSGFSIQSVQPFVSRTHENGIYTVRSGDTFNSIAQSFNISPLQLAVWNGYAEPPSLIIIGSRFAVTRQGVESQLSDAEKSRRPVGETTPLYSVPQEFIDDFAPLAIEVATQAGRETLWPSLMIAQAAHESNYGRSGLASPPYHNLSGIKSRGNQPSVLMWTWEVINNTRVDVLQDFRTFPSYTHSLQAYADLLRGGTSWDSTYYSGTWVSNSEDVWDVLDNRGLSGYATDPNYYAAIRRIIDQYDLTQYDRSILGETTDKIDEILQLSQVTVFNGIINSANESLYTKPQGLEGSEVTITSESLNGQRVVIRRKHTHNGEKWLLVEKSGELLGWINSKYVTGQYESIRSEDTVAYRGNITGNGRYQVFSRPAYTEGNEQTVDSSQYDGERVIIRSEITTSSGRVWVLVSHGSNQLGWINKAAIAPDYDQAAQRTDLNYEATITASGNYQIFNVPAYFEGNRQVGNSADYYSQVVTVVEEVRTTQGRTWVLLEKDGQTLGWINSNGIERNLDRVVNEANSVFDGTINSSNARIYSLPGNTNNSEIIDDTTNLNNRKVTIRQIAETSQGFTWYYITIGNQLSGWINSEYVTEGYETIRSEETVAYRGNITGNGRYQIFSRPAYTEGNEQTVDSSQYDGERVIIRSEITTSSGRVWVLVSHGSNQLGWINKAAIAPDYDQAAQRTDLNYEATITASGNYQIFNVPAYFEGNRQVGNSADYYSQVVTVVEEIRTTQGRTWVLLEKDGQTLGWINSNGIEPDETSVFGHQRIAYSVSVDQRNYPIYSDLPAVESNVKGQSGEVLNQTFTTRESIQTPTRTLLHLNGIGWIDENAVSYNYDLVNLNRTVAYNASIKNGNFQIFSTPAYTEGNVQVATSSEYQGINFVVREEKVTANGRTWVKVVIDGQEIGWINKNSLDAQYDEILRNVSVNHRTKTLTSSNYQIFNVPAYTAGNYQVDASRNYLNRSVNVLEEVITVRAQWSLIALNGRTLGWVNSRALSNPTVFLDPGHGGSDTGATATLNGRLVTEKEINLQVSLKLRDLLQNQGYNVLMTREDDRTISNLDRGIMVNQSNADIFLSIHHNALSSSTPGYSTVHGIETFYYLPNHNYPPTNNPDLHDNPYKLSRGRDLAYDIQNGLLDETRARHRRVDNAAFVVIKEVNIPAALTELGFMTNQSELSKLITDSYQNDLARGMLNGINSYFSN